MSPQASQLVLPLLAGLIHAPVLSHVTDKQHRHMDPSRTLAPSSIHICDLVVSLLGPGDLRGKEWSPVFRRQIAVVCCCPAHEWP